MTFKPYRRKQIAELRPYEPGENLFEVSISAEDQKAGSPKPGDMIARNPKNHKDQWLVAAAYFAENFEALSSPAPEAASAMRGEQRTICEACGNSNLAHDRAVWTDDGSSFCPDCAPTPDAAEELEVVAWGETHKILQAWRDEDHQDAVSIDRDKAIDLCEEYRTALAIIENLRAENERLTMGWRVASEKHESFAKKWDKENRRRKSAEARLAEAVEALRFYAADGSWQDDIAPDPAGTSIPYTSPAAGDRGARARTFLQSLGKEG